MEHRDTFKTLLENCQPNIFLNNFDFIWQSSMQIKVFDIFCDYVLCHINEVLNALNAKKISSDVYIKLLKALHYNQNFYKMSVSQRFNIVEFLVDFLYSTNKNKIDNSFIEGGVLLFATTDASHYQQFLNKHKISNNQIVHHENFVNYFALHASLSYQMCDKDYEKYLESNLKKGFPYILSTFLIKLIHESHDFDNAVTAFFNLSVKHQRKVLDTLKRLYDYFETIDLKIKTISGINIYGYVMVSFFKNARDYITPKHIESLEKQVLPEHEELVLFIKQKLGHKDILHRYINKKLSDKSLALIPTKFLCLEDLFQNINDMNLPKSNKDYTCSVIVTTHNPDIHFLTLSVDSLLNQTLKNVEIIIVDDCSDNSDEIKKLQEKSNAIKYIRSDINQGAYISRNIAIKQITGDYIFFQDDDDVSHPQRLEYSVDNLLASKAKIFHTCVMRFSRNGLVQLDTSAVISSGGPVAMCFHKDTFNKLGEFMTFRSRGDVEYRARCQKRFGKDSYVSEMDLPLYYALGSSTSLSRSFESGASFYNLEINRSIISEAVI
jgi:hypothetical protein